jgi:hypothetical protein
MILIEFLNKQSTLKFILSTGLLKYQYIFRSKSCVRKYAKRCENVKKSENKKSFNFINNNFLGTPDSAQSLRGEEQPKLWVEVIRD